MNSKNIRPLFLIKVFLVGVCLLFFKSSYAQEKFIDKHKLDLSISAGYQKENFNWSIDGNNSQGNYINVLSELKWKKLKGPSVTADIKWNVWKSLVLQTNFSTTVITSGRVTDTDYNDNNRTTPVYNGVFNSDKGAITSMAFLSGYKFFKENKYNFTLSAGYSNNKQSLHILDDN